MTLLLDTCTYLWAIGEPARLSPAADRAIRHGGAKVAVSIVTLWEVLLKHGKRQLDLETRGETALGFLRSQCEIHRFDLLPIGAATLEPLERLPFVHRDPFDRLLICQAIEHGMTLVTPDDHIRRYPVKTLWD